MSREVIPVLFFGLHDAYERLRARLAGLTAAEFLWEPVLGAWTVREVDGRWLPDRAASRADEPDPAPITTIAWRLWHTASCLASYVTPHLGDWPLDVPEGEWCGEPAPALDALDTAYGSFRERISGLGEDGIWSKLGPRWGPFADETWATLTTHCHDEVAHHGAEIALLRDLYLRLG